jgi:hypothetical protein
MMLLKRAALAVLAGGLMGGAAHAASLSYDFTLNGVPTGTGAKPTYAFTNGGVTASVTAQYTTDAARTVWAAANVYRTAANGLGVHSPAPDANNAMIDAVENNERLLFDFSADVSVLSISFKNSGTNDRAAVGLFDGVTNVQIQTFFLGNAAFVQALSIPVPNAKTFYLSAIPSGFSAPAPNAIDWFSVSAISAQTGLVPVPASVWAGVGLLSVLGLVRRRAGTISA